MQIKINDQIIEAIQGETILEAARRHDIHIPTLCYHEAFGGQGHCRLCLVEICAGGAKRLVASCTYPITAEIEVQTSTPGIEKLRRNIIKLLYKKASGSEFMQDLAQEADCDAIPPFNEDGERCILCYLCVNACAALGSSAISAVLRGVDKKITTPYDGPSEVCLGCGACAAICPTGAIALKQEGGIRTLWQQDFELVACESCGQLFATRQQLDYLTAHQADRVGNNLCEACRKSHSLGTDINRSIYRRITR